MRIRRVFAAYWTSSAPVAAAFLLLGSTASAAPAPAASPTAAVPAPTAAAPTAAAPTAAELAKKLASADKAERLAAAEALHQLGRGAAPAAPALAKALSDAYWPVRFEAAETLGELGSAGVGAVPQLAKAVSDPEAAVRTAALSTLGRLGADASAAVDAIEKAAADSDPHVQVSAIQALARIDGGDRVVKQLPALTAALSSTVAGVPEAAVSAFAEIGAPAAPVLSALVRGADVKAAAAAAEALAEMGSAAKGAVPALTEALSSPDDGVVRAAAEALAASGTSDAAVLPALIAALQKTRKTPGVRAELAVSLAKLARSSGDGPRLRELQALGLAAADDDARVRRGALAAIARIAPKGPVFQKLLVRALKDENAGVRIEAAALLATLDAETLAAMAPQVAPACEASLADPESRQSALLVIGHLGPAAKGCASKLLPLLQDESAQTRLSALVALAAIEADDPAVLSTVAAELDDPSRGVRHAAAFALGKAGPKASGAVAALEKLAAGDDALSGSLAAWALARIEPKNSARLQTAVERVVAGLCAASPSELPIFVEALGELKAEPKSVLVELQKHLAHTDERRAAQVLRALASLGEHAVPALTEALSDPHVRQGAAAVLGGLGPAAAPAVSAMTKGLSSDDFEFRSELLIAFGRLGSVSKPAYPSILERLTAVDSSYAEQQAACYALGRLKSDARGALPTLAEIIAGKKPGPKVAAAWATVGIAPQEAAADAKVVGLLIEGLKDARPVMRQAAAKALGELGKGAAAAVPALKIVAADDHDSGVAAAAAASLNSIAP